MRTIYSNTRFRWLIECARWAIDILCVLTVVGIFIISDVPVCFFLFGLLALLILRPQLSHLRHSYCLDEKRDILFDVNDEYSMVQLSGVYSVTYRLTSSGEFDSMVLYDRQGRSLEVFLCCRDDADEIVDMIRDITDGVTVDTEYPYLR